MLGRLTLTICRLLKLTMGLTGVYERGKRQVFRLVKLVPSVKEKLEKELASMSKSFENDIIQRLKEDPFVTKLPEIGLSPDQVLNKVKEYTELGKKIVSKYKSFIFLLYKLE